MYQNNEDNGDNGNNRHGNEFVRNKFSIIIPALNEEKYLGACLESITKLDYPKEDYEVIVIDGRSEDGTREIAKDYGARLFISDVRRCGYQRQIGVDNAKGNIISFVDADCIVYPNLLTEFNKVFQKRYVSAVQGKLLLSDARFFENIIGAHIFNMSLQTLAPLGLFATGGNMAIRKNVMDAIGGISREKETNDDIEVLRKARKHGFVAYHKNAIVLTSTRRIRKWGYAKTLTYQFSNIIRYNLLGSSHKGYENLR
jgi:glycosyltransferase involved in cell wall biosynthesis